MWCALRRYLVEGRTRTAVELAKKGVVLLWPQLGRVVWPVGPKPQRS